MACLYAALKLRTDFVFFQSVRDHVWPAKPHVVVSGTLTALAWHLVSMGSVFTDQHWSLKPAAARAVPAAEVLSRVGSWDIALLVSDGHVSAPLLPHCERPHGAPSPSRRCPSQERSKSMRLRGPVPTRLL